MPAARRSLRRRSIDFSTLVKQLVDEGRLTFKEGQQLGKFTYHDSCHLKRTLNASRSPARADGARPATSSPRCTNADMCCGMGGSYSLKLPEISAPILERKLQEHRGRRARRWW